MTDSAATNAGAGGDARPTLAGGDARPARGAGVLACAGPDPLRELGVTVTGGFLTFTLTSLGARWGRHLILTAAVTLATAALFFGSLLATGIMAGIESGVSRLGADVLVSAGPADAASGAALIAGRPTLSYMDPGTAGAVAAVPGVEAVSPQVFIRSLKSPCCDTGDVLLVGFDPSSDFTVRPWIAGGAFAPFGVIVGADILYDVGGRVRFFNTEMDIAGKLDRSGFDLFDRSVFVPMAMLRRLSEKANPEDQAAVAVAASGISAVLVKVAPGSAPETVGALIGRTVPGISATTSSSTIRGVREQLASAGTWALGMLATLWTPTLALLAAMFWMMTRERRRELGMLRAVGATRGFVLGLLLTESVLVTGSGGVLGVLAGGLAALSIRDNIVESLRLPCFWTGESAGLLALACVGLAILAGLAAVCLPALRIARQDPHDLVRVEEG